MSQTLLTNEKYQIVIGDSIATPSVVSSAIEDSIGLWEEELGRKLVLQEYTETLFVNQDGRVFPNAVPVQSVADDTYLIEFDGYSLLGALPVLPPIVIAPWINPMTVEVTYIGGFDQTNVPSRVQRNIAKTAYNILHPQSGMPEDATNVKMGDVQVQFANPTSSFRDISDAQRKEMKPYYRRGL